MIMSIASVVWLQLTFLSALTQRVQSFVISKKVISYKLSRNPILSKNNVHHERTVPKRLLDGTVPQRTSGLNVGNEHEQKTPYRSIGEVVGGLHGGKYQFSQGGSYGDSGFVGRSSTSRIQEEEDFDEEQMPKWAKNMDLPEGIESWTTVQIIEVPSNSNRMDGMLRTSTVTITNDERTWEQFYVKIIPRYGMNSLLPDGQTPTIPFRVRPRSGHLAPRGGASNACDSNQPYLDSATIIVFHDENVAGGPLDGSVEWWLVAGTEEEKWYFKLKYVV